MEGVPKQEMQFEKGADGWWELRDTAPAQADELIAHIEGFDDMSADERVRAFQSLLLTLSSDNANRFTCEEIAKRLTLLEAENAYQAAAERNAQMPTGRVLTQA